MSYDWIERDGRWVFIGCRYLPGKKVQDADSGMLWRIVKHYAHEDREWIELRRVDFDPDVRHMPCPERHGYEEFFPLTLESLIGAFDPWFPPPAGPSWQG